MGEASPLPGPGPAAWLPAPGAALAVGPSHAPAPDAGEGGAADAADTGTVALAAE